MPGPIFQNITPAPGASIDPLAQLSFEVVDAGSGIVLVVPIITLDPNAAGELLHDWTLNVFSPIYAMAGATRLAIANGYRYTFRRGYGWPSPPILRVWAVDAAGNVGVL